MAARSGSNLDAARPCATLGRCFLTPDSRFLSPAFMAIDVTCASCKTRFQVSDKFAGKQGPCPKCKAIIKVPDKSQQVVIHAPEETGPKGVTGQPVFKPIAWKETRLTTPQIVIIAASVLGVLLATIAFRIAFGPGNTPLIALMVGSVVLAPPLAFAGYAVLRDDELAPHQGKDLLLRLIAPTVVYPGLWALYWFIFYQLAGYVAPNWQIMCVVVPVVVAIGAVAAQVSLDLELGTAALHYSIYLLATLVLRFILMGADKLLWNEASKPAAAAAALLSQCWTCAAG